MAPFFDRLSHVLNGKWADVEVASLDVGDQLIAEWAPIYGITYDSTDDSLDVAFDRFDHLIRHPTDIVVEDGPDGIHSVAVVDREGARQVVRLKQPLPVPPATGIRA